MAIVMVIVHKVCSRGCVQGLGELSGTGINELLSLHANRHVGDISVTVFVWLSVCLSVGVLVTDISAWVDVGR